MAMNQQRLFTERNFEDDVEDEGSESECDSDDSDTDPSFTMDDTSTKFSDRSVKKKTKACFNLESESDPDEEEVSEQKLDEKDEKSFELVQKVIEAGQIEKLKVDQCKVYLRKNGLRLTGNKGTLIQRIKEHLEILNGGGEKKYPPSSFVLNCKGDACMGDVVMFEQNVYEMFNLASRSASGPPCGTRIVVGRIVKESYGAAKQQHTFTVEVLWSKGEKQLPPLHPLLIKGRNLYRLKTLRQRWEDEGQRQKALMEKHSRGSLARSDREVRMKEKKMRKMLRETRISRKAEPKKKQAQSNFPAGVEQLVQPQHQQTGCLIGLAGHSQQLDSMKLAGASQASIGLASHFQQVDSSKLATPFHQLSQQLDKMNLARAFQKSSSLVNSRKSTIQPQHAGFAVDYATAATEHQKNNQMQQMDTQRIYSSSIQDVQHRRSFDCDANYNLQLNHSSLQDHVSHNKYPNWSSVKTSHVQPLTRNTHMDWSSVKTSHVQPLTRNTHMDHSRLQNHVSHNKYSDGSSVKDFHAQPLESNTHMDHSRLQNHVSHNKYSDGSSVKDFHAQPLGSNTHMDHSRLQDHVSHNKYSNGSPVKAFHARPLRSNIAYMDQSRLQGHVSRNKYSNGSSVKDSHVQPLGRNTHMNPPQRENHTLRQPCQHYARGRCYFGENCKFLHEWREEYPQRREEAWRCGRNNLGSRPYCS